MKKVIVYFLAFLLLIFLVGSFFISRQEKNVFPIWYGILALPFYHDEILQVSENTYIAFSNDESEKIKKWMQEKNYDFIEQMWAGYFFENSKWERTIITTQRLTRKFIILHIDKNLE